MKKGIILDFNGTLLDDRDVCLKILNILTRENNLEPVSLQQYLDIFTFPVVSYYKDLGFDLNNFEKVAIRFHGLYNELYPIEAKIFDDVIKTLKYLKENNIEIICLSASKQETLIKQLKYFGIYEYFDVVLGLSDQYANSKENIALEFIKNKDSSDYLFVGDSIHDFEVASSMNVDCVLVATGHTSKNRLQACKCPTVDTLYELKNYL